jgi:hypothetical protein
MSIHDTTRSFEELTRERTFKQKRLSLNPPEKANEYI